MSQICLLVVSDVCNRRPSSCRACEGAAWNPMLGEWTKETIESGRLFDNGGRTQKFDELATSDLFTVARSEQKVVEL